VKTALLAVLLLLMSLIPAGAIAMSPRDGEPVAVVFMPGTDEATVLSRVVSAGGLLLGRGAAGNAIVVLPGRKDFIHAAYRSGAIMILAARGVRGCGPQPNADRSDFAYTRSATLERPVDR
jgi:hypothetical protein